MIQTGLMRLTAEPELRKIIAGKRIGLLGHHASFTGNLVFAADALRAAGARIERLFGPEHGFWGAAQDMIPVDGGLDPVTGLPVVSLYGDHEGSLTPRAEAFEGLDAVVIDLQDIGSRYYTYVATAAKVVLAARTAGVMPIVCDRPNPIGGAVEGNHVLPSLRSFVGAFDTPQRHGMTLGELVQMQTGGAATVIPMSGYHLGLWWDETGLPWIPPSPNMPTLTTAAVYPGLCLIEGTSLSEGRGTTTPFEVFGAPGIDPFRLAAGLESEGLAGVRFRPHVFLPTFQKHARLTCGGVQIVITDRRRLQPVRLGLAVLRQCCQLFPEATRWREAEYEYVTDRKAIDLLLGEPGLSEALRDGAPISELTRGFASAEAAFDEQARPWRLYPRS